MKLSAPARPQKAYVRIALHADAPKGVVVHWAEPGKKARQDAAKDNTTKRGATDGIAMNDQLAELAVAGWERMTAAAFREFLPHRVSPEAGDALASALAAAGQEQINPSDEVEIGTETRTAKAWLTEESSDWRARISVLLNVIGEVAAAEDALIKNEHSSSASTGA